LELVGLPVIAVTIQFFQILLQLRAAQELLAAAVLIMVLPEVLAAAVLQGERHQAAHLGQAGRVIHLHQVLLLQSPELR
jgi:hypothetical protein